MLLNSHQAACVSATLQLEARIGGKAIWSAVIALAARLTVKI